MELFYNFASFLNWGCSFLCFYIVVTLKWEMGFLFRSWIFLVLSRYVTKFVKKSERQAACEEPSFTNVYVNNLDNELTDDLLKEKFSTFGTVKNAAIMKDDHGQSRGFGFVCFESPEDAKKAVETMNGAQIGKLLCSFYLFPFCFELIFL